MSCYIFSVFIYKPGRLTLIRLPFFLLTISHLHYFIQAPQPHKSRRKGEEGEGGGGQGGEREISAGGDGRAEEEQVGSRAVLYVAVMSCHVICCTCMHYNALHLTCCSVDCAVRCCICVDIVYCMCLWGCLRCPWSQMTQSNLSLFGAFSSVYIMHL